MKRFKALDDYSIDGLIYIVYGEPEDWQKDAVEYAGYLLTSKGISEEFAEIRFKEIEEDYQAYLQEEFEERAFQTYSILELILITLFWWRRILWDWHLKKDGYLKKHKQRIYAIGAGIVLYVAFVINAFISIDASKQDKVDEINRLTLADSLNIASVDWTGIYEFVDTSEDTTENIIWELVLEKTDLNHTGVLRLKNKNQEHIIKCVGLIKDQDIEFFPDTTYHLFNNTTISYFDNLFSFSHDESRMMTYWVKMKPFFERKHIGSFKEKHFLSNNSSKGHRQRRR